MGKQDYEQAQEILNTLPKTSPVDREQAQANIYIAQGDLEKAAKLIEEKLLSATNEIHAELNDFNGDCTSKRTNGRC